MRHLYLAASAALLAVPAQAAVVYSNNFNAENGGNSALNFNGFNGLSVTNGTVDLIKSGDFGITCAGGSGSCVDLDGSTGDAGLTSSGSYAFAKGDRVSLSFLYSGNQRNVPPADFFRTRFNFTPNTAGKFRSQSTLFGAQNFGTFSNVPAFRVDIFNIAPNAPMTDFTFIFEAFTPGSLTFSFEDFGNDNVGVVIDNVSLDISAIPEPASWAMMIAGFGMVGAGMRRRNGRTVLA